jgi:endogenous inhibitor of DNA gyrase (YacG/DUF329 family)
MDRSKLASEEKIIKCPTCKEEFNYYSSAFRPFCCMRCRQVDLGHWFNETYAVAAEPIKDPLLNANESPEEGNES